MSDERKQGWRQRVSAWWPFALLCLLGSTRWLVTDRWPDAGSTLASSSVGCGVAALMVLLAGWALRACTSRRETGANATLFTDALGGVLLVGGPIIGMVLLPHGLDNSALMIALALTPVVAGVACVASGEECESLAGHLWPGLAALTGILLVLPQPSLADPAADIAMGLAPIMTGVGAVLMAGRQSSADDEKQSGNGRLATMHLTTALSAAALFLGVFALLRSGFAEARASFAIPAAVLDGALALLAVVCVRRLGAMRFSAEFVIVPLLVLLEGLVLMRPTITFRTELSMALLLLAGVVLAVRSGDARQPKMGVLDLR